MYISSLIGLDLSVLAGLAPYILLFGGVVAVSKLLSLFIKGSAGSALKALGYLGIFVGALLLATGVVILLEQTSLKFGVYLLLRV